MRNFVSIGTRLPTSLEEANIARKEAESGTLKRKKDSNVNEFIPVWKQEARDDQGRKRFHGAFTGGYSAGYYNTVGSKEGWTPSTFQSSRKGKSTDDQGKKRRTLTREDIMDEEDWESFSGGGKRVWLSFGSGSRNISEILLKSVGFLQDGVSSGETPVQDSNVSFGRRRRRQQQQQQQGRRLIDQPESRMASGFGIGALEDEDEEDRDIYDSNIEEMRKFSKNFDDFDGNAVDGNIGTNGSKDKKSSLPLFKMEFACNVPGFVGGKALIVFENISTKITIPDDWKPKRMANVNVEIISKGVAKSGSMDARKRAQILKEEELYGKRKSNSFSANQVYDQDDDQDVDQRKDTPAIEGCPWLTAWPSLEIFTKLDARQALLALQGFQPFHSTDPAKQIRYTRFLEACMEGSSKWAQVIFPPHYLESDIGKELEEFNMAARVYQPMGASMASRFVRGSLEPPSSKDTVDVDEGKKTNVDVKTVVGSNSSNLQQYERDAVLAKRMGVGLTRYEYDWTPSTLLCRRFNVKDPHPDRPVKLYDNNPSSSSYTAPAKMLLAPETILPVLSDHVQNRRREGKNVGSSVSKSKASDFFTLEEEEQEQEQVMEEKGVHGKKDENVNFDDEAPLPERPKMSLFQSIFGSNE